MKQFVLLFRMDITTKEAQPSAKQMQLYMQQWQQWIATIASKGKLAEGGNHLSREGVVLKSHNNLTDGPYTVNKESVAGYIIVLANSFEKAVTIAKDCPILQGEGTSVEVRKAGGAS